MTVSSERSVDIFLEHEGEHFADALSPHTRRYTRQLAAELDELPGLAGTKSGLEELLDESINNPYRGRQLAKEALETLLLFMRPFIATLPSDATLRHLHNNTKTPFAQTIVAVMMQLPKTAPVFSSQFHTCADAEPMIMRAVRGAVTTVSAEKMQLSARACVLKDEDGRVVGLQKTDYEASVMPIATQPEKGLFAGVFSEPLRPLKPTHFMAHCDVVEVPASLYGGFRPLRPSASTFDKPALTELVTLAEPYVDDQSRADMVHFSDAAFVKKALRLADKAAPYQKTTFVGP